MARMQKETEFLEKEIRRIEKTHSENLLSLVLASGYLRKLLGNNRVVRFLSKRHAALLEESEKIETATSLDAREKASAPAAEAEGAARLPEKHALPERAR